MHDLSMPTPPTTPKFFAHYEAAQSLLSNAAATEDATDRLALATMANAYATLAATAAVWLKLKD